jgi:signal transduction histidine kinase
VERPTVLIISEEPEFVRAITNRWQAELSSPRLAVNGDHTADVALCIVGTAQIPEVLQRSGVPVIHISHETVDVSGTISVPKTNGWTELTIAIAEEILERQKVAFELARLSELNSKLEREASLGRYILETRHSLNNALTSILGNSELMLMDTQSIPPSARFQIETVRNMAMRMNEILQRFTSLQKEMQLAEQQSAKKLVRGVGAGS